MSFERLQDKIREMKNPTVAGLDPKLEYVPSFIVEEKMKQYGQTLRCAAEAIYEYNVGLIDALFCEVNPIPVKQALALEGIPAGLPRLPLTPLSEAHAPLLERELAAMPEA